MYMSFQILNNVNVKSFLLKFFVNQIIYSFYFSRTVKKLSAKFFNKTIF